MADNPETGTTEEQDGSIESASQAILGMEEVAENQEGDETQRTEDSSEEEVAEEADGEEEADEELADEEESENQLYTVKVDGKDVETTLDELKSGYLRQGDYSKKTDELAGQRKALLDEAAGIQQERQRYAQALGQMQTDAEKQLADYKSIDWNQLREADSMLFMQRRDEMRELEKSIEDGKREQHQLVAQAQQYQNQKFQSDVETGRQHLIAEMPDWDDTVSKSVREFGLGAGFSHEELAGITDHRSMVVLRKAMLYDNIKNSKPTKKKIKADTPKYVKPGVAKSKGDISAKQRADKFKKLKKSGTVEDGASMIYDLL